MIENSKNNEVERIDNASNMKVENGLAEATGLHDYAWNQLTSPATLFYNTTPYILSFNWIQLSNAYKSMGFAQTAVDLPVDDAFREGGLDIDCATLDKNELELLKQTMEDNNDWEEIKNTIKWSRLYGGGVLIADIEGQRTFYPLDQEELFNSPLRFYACDRWQAYQDGYTFDLSNNFTLTNYSVDGKTINALIDRTKCFPFVSKTAPYYLRAQLQGWGLSIFEQMLSPLTQFLKSNSVILELLDEAKIDVLKIAGLSSTLLSPGGTAKIRSRVDVAAANKNYKSMITMDVNDDYQQKQLSFAGLPDLMEQIQILVSAALRIPRSKLFGTGSSGFSSGEDDLENYNAMVKSDIQLQATKLIKWVIDLRCLQLFGRKLPDITIKWKPLRVLNARDEQDIISKKIADIMLLKSNGLLTPKQAATKLTELDLILYSDEELAKLSDDFEDDIDYLNQYVDID